MELDTMSRALERANVMSKYDLLLYPDLTQLSLRTNIESRILEQCANYIADETVAGSGCSMSALEEYGMILQGANGGVIGQTRNAAFDQLLASYQGDTGGLRPGEILELCGIATTALDQMLLQMCADTLMRSENSRVVYIDTRGHFAPLRLASILESSCGLPNAATSATDRMELISRLERLEHISVYGVHDLMNALQDISRRYTTVSSPPTNGGDAPSPSPSSPSPLLVCINSLPAALHIDSNSKVYGSVNSETIARTLRQLVLPRHHSTQHWQCGVVLINSVSEIPPHSEHERTSLLMTNKRPAMGIAWVHVPDIRIHVHSAQLGSDSKDKQYVTCEIVKSNRAAAHKWASFYI
ncbi:hypothetical protein GQ42DRAFT_164643 [Ramicandelaber brevisporus]|nr:hypothetical protein GQ42DRAFT_164643 [Ramicandelaber brevisporus]